MASYQNTSEYYCGVTMDSYPEHVTNPNVYFEQNPSNFQVHDVGYLSENYTNQAVFPMLSSGANICETRQVVHDNSHYYGNPVSQYHQLQYTPLTRESVLYPGIHLEPRPHKNNNYTAKRHHAQITIVPSSKGNFKAVVKRKRKRTIFTTEQVEGLEEIFKKQQYVSREERQLIGNNLKINDKAVKIWFQNRRLKTKRLQDQEEQEDCSNVEHSEEESSSPNVTRLNSVESEIRKNTNEYGFVTLNDGVMGNLTNVINDFLTNSSVPVKNIVANNTRPTYEPISPASVHDNNEEENTICWRPSEPSESLQRLFDLQSMPML